MTTARQLESGFARINWIRAVDKICVEQMTVEQSNFEQFTPTLLKALSYWKEEIIKAKVE